MTLTTAAEGRTTSEANRKSRELRDRLRTLLVEHNLLFSPSQDMGNNPTETGAEDIFGNTLKAPLTISGGQSICYPGGLILRPIYQSGKGSAYKIPLLETIANQSRYPVPVAMIFAGKAFSEDNHLAPARSYRKFRANFAQRPEMLPGVAFVGSVTDFAMFIDREFAPITAEVA